MMLQVITDIYFLAVILGVEARNCLKYNLCNKPITSLDMYLPL